MEVDDSATDDAEKGDVDATDGSVPDAEPAADAAEVAKVHFV